MISVIVPAHNEKANLMTLLPRLASLSKGYDVEVLVSLSSSTDDGSHLIPTLDHTRFIHCPKDGRAVQMNTAVGYAKGDILVFLHADVRPPRGFFRDIKSTLENGHQAGFFSYRFDKENFFLNLNASFTKKDGVFTGGGDQCLFIQRNVFDALNGFDEAQVLMEDFEFFHRMKSNKVPYTIVENDLTVSARKYNNNSYVRVNLTNLILVILFRFGVAPKTLLSLHKRYIR